jgi:hypothetical protein
MKNVFLPHISLTASYKCSIIPTYTAEPDTVLVESSPLHNVGLYGFVDFWQKLECKCLDIVS